MGGSLSSESSRRGVCIPADDRIDFSDEEDCLAYNEECYRRELEEEKEEEEMEETQESTARGTGVQKTNPLLS